MTVRVTGQKEVERQLRALHDAINDPQTHLLALTAAAMPIQEQVVATAPWKTGDYRRSIHTETVSRVPPRVAIGTDKPQAARLEFGFSGTDSLGRRYNQPARPHWRPAIAGQLGKAKAEYKRVLTALLKRRAK